MCFCQSISQLESSPTDMHGSEVKYSNIWSHQEVLHRFGWAMNEVGFLSDPRKISHFYFRVDPSCIISWNSKMVVNTWPKPMKLSPFFNSNNSYTELTGTTIGNRCAGVKKHGKRPKCRGGFIELTSMRQTISEHFCFTSVHLFSFVQCVICFLLLSFFV